MAITANAYGSLPVGQFSATAARRIDWASDTIKVLLTTSAYTPDQDTHTYLSDVTNEITGTGYTAGGQALSGKSVAYDSATNETRLIAAATTWSAATITARRAVVYKDTGSAATSPLIGWVDFGVDQSITGADLALTWDATNGVVKVAVA